MKTLILSLILALSFGCSTTPEKVVEKGPSERVTQYMTQYEEDFEEVNPAFIDLYTKYLSSVEEIYKKNEISPKFDSYLRSLRNNAQILSHHTHQLPQIYRREKGRWVNPKSADYKLFLTKKITALNDELVQKREENLRKEVGEEVFQQLKNDYQSFRQNHERAEEFNFPL